MTEAYSQRVLEYFLNPRNIGVIEDADAQATVANPHCGDEMTIYLKIARREDGAEYIEDAKVQTYGCVAAIATSSMATELVKGKTLEEARKLSAQAIKDALEGLPASKVHCSLLADQALQQAIEAYLAERQEAEKSAAGAASAEAG